MIITRRRSKRSPSEPAIGADEPADADPRQQRGAHPGGGAGAVEHRRDDGDVGGLGARDRDRAGRSRCVGLGAGGYVGVEADMARKGSEDGGGGP